MKRLQRYFSKLSESVLSLDSLTYKYPWTLSQINNIKLSRTPSAPHLQAFSILAETYTKDLKIIHNFLSKLENSINPSGLSYTLNRDYLSINLTGLNSFHTKVKKIVEMLQVTQTSDYKSSKPLQDIESILVSSCFDSPQIQNSQFLFTGEFFVSTSLDLQETDLPIVEKKPLRQSELYGYKPAMVLVESPSEFCEVAIAFKAPGLLSGDYFLFKFMETFFATDPQLYVDQTKQFNYLNSLFSGIPGIYSHSVKYYAGTNSGVLIHTLNTHPFAAAFAAAAIIKASKRVTKEIILYELERTQGAIFNSILQPCPLVERCESRNIELYSGKSLASFQDFLINLSEEYLCNTLSKHFDAQFPSVVLKGKIPSENAIENIFNIKL